MTSYPEAIKLVMANVPKAQVVAMEALVAVAIAALTIYDMCKKYKRDIRIQEMYLIEKRGGRSGAYKRKDSFY